MMKRRLACALCCWVTLAFAQREKSLPRLKVSENHRFLVQADGNRIQLKSTVNMKKAVFEAADYDALREFFGYVVKKQNEQIVFKRKK